MLKVSNSIKRIAVSVVDHCLEKLITCHLLAIGLSSKYEYHYVRTNTLYTAYENISSDWRVWQLLGLYEQQFEEQFLCNQQIEEVLP